MARIINLAVEAAGVQDRYSAIHEELLGSSIRRWASIAGLRRPVDHATLETNLEALESRLGEIRVELAALPASELTKRARDDIRTALDAYVHTLASAIGKLRVIGARMRESEESGAGHSGYSTEQLNEDKADYDLAVQSYKRCGVRLSRLLSTY